MWNRNSRWPCTASADDTAITPRTEFFQAVTRPRMKPERGEGVGAAADAAEEGRGALPGAAATLVGGGVVREGCDAAATGVLFAFAASCARRFAMATCACWNSSSCSRCSCSKARCCFSRSSARGSRPDEGVAAGPDATTAVAAVLNDWADGAAGGGGLGVTCSFEELTEFPTPAPPCLGCDGLDDPDAAAERA